MTTQILSQERLKELLHYNPDTGVFMWRVNRGGSAKAGCVAGGINSVTKYRMIKIDGKKFLAHRLAFLYVDGDFPKEQVDHRNHVRHDNWWKNIRCASRNDNSKNRTKYNNNSSGVSGVSWHKQSKKWTARIQVNNKRVALGYFNSIEDAENAQKSARLRYGFHKNHGV